MAGTSSKVLAFGDPKNNEKTFQEQRFDDDLDLNWVQFKWRNHDPQIGRFVEVDPLSEKYVYNSTYAFSENKVIAHIELEGLESVPIKYSNPLEPILIGFGEGMIAIGNWFDHAFSFGSKKKVEIPVNKNGNANIVIETKTEYSTNIGGILNSIKYNDGKPDNSTNLPSLIKSENTTSVSVEQKLEVKTPIGKSTTKASVTNDGKITVEQKGEVNTKRGVTVGATASQSSNGDKKIGLDATVGSGSTNAKAGATFTQNGNNKNVEISVGAEQKVGDTKVSTFWFIKMNK